MELWAVEYQLVNASPEYVFEWLKDNVVEKHSLDDKRDKLEEALLSRNEKLINLGLALYGVVPAIGYKLFKLDDSVIKRAVLSGRSVHPGFIEKSWVLNQDVIPLLLEEAKKKSVEYDGDDFYSNEESFLHVLLNNKFIPSDIIEAVFEKSAPFNDIDDDLWIELVAMTVNNERLSIPYESTWMDGFDEYRYNLVFTSGWKLYKEFPVTIKAASILSMLAEKLVPKIPHDMDVLNVMERWKSKDADDKEYNPYTYARAGLVKIIRNYSEEFKELKNSEDLAMRQGYYSYLDWAKPSDVTEGFEKDGKDFLDCAIYNNSFYKNKETLEALRQTCWGAPDEDYRLDYPNYFNSRVEYLTSKYPEWFKDDFSGEIPFEDIEDPDIRLEKRLEDLSSKVTALHKSLLGDKEQYQDDNELEENSILNDLNLELKNIGEHLGKLYSKSSFSWGWLVAGIILGFILASF